MHQHQKMTSLIQINGGFPTWSTCRASKATINPDISKIISTQKEDVEKKKRVSN
jgi:hypothetical protein